MTRPLWFTVLHAAIMVGMIIAFLVAARYSFPVFTELRRARRAGELGGYPGYDIPFVIAEFLPFIIYFKKDILPRVEKERRRLSFAMAIFVLGWLAGVVLDGCWQAFHG